MIPDPQHAVVRQFNESINRRDLAALAALMTADHTFIDSADDAVHGKENVLQAWKGFFEAFPDYRNTFWEMSSCGEVVTIVGYSTCSDERLRGPAIWTARIENERVAEWRVYEDTHENRQRLGIGIA
jgi:ketosteroid isomerase-like protein